MGFNTIEINLVVIAARKIQATKIDMSKHDIAQNYCYD